MRKRSPKITLLAILILCACTAHTAVVPQDYAVVLRDTPVYESLELYAPVISNAKARQYFSVKSVVTDEYGILWAEVELEGKQRGFLTDVVTLRMEEDVLTSILAEVKAETFELWDQDSLEQLMQRQITVGMDYLSMLLANGKPLSFSNHGEVTEYCYSQKRYLLKNNEIIAILNQQQVASQKRIEIELNQNSPELELQGTGWDTENILLGSDSGDKATFSFSVPVSGTYSFTTEVSSNPAFTSQAVYRLANSGTILERFYVNQKLKHQQVNLGQYKLQSGKKYSLGITSESGEPFAIGTITITYLNIPGVE